MIAIEENDVTRRFTHRTAILALAGVALLAAACSSIPAASSTAVTRPHKPRALTGIVASLGPSSLVVRSRSGTKTITLRNSTKYAKRRARITESNLAVGERVRVRLVSGDSTATAAAVSILASGLSGTVSALTPSGFTLTTRSGVAHAITILPTTIYRQGKTSASASSLQSGAKVRVSGRIEANGSMTASSVNIH